MKTDWENLFKIRLASSDESMQKHEVVKLLLVMKLISKNIKRKDWIRVYTEFELDNGLIADVYFEDVKNKEALAFEIQKDYSKKWLKEKGEKYKDWEIPFFNSADWIPIDLNKSPEKIEEISIWLEKYVP